MNQSGTDTPVGGAANQGGTDTPVGGAANL